MTHEQKIERFAERELRRNLSAIIVPDDANGYVVFGKYHLSPVAQGFKVSSWHNDIGIFGSKRSAISWCVADKHKQYSLAFQIKTLDQKKGLLEADLHVRRALAERSRHAEFNEVVYTKMQPKISMYNSVTAELEKCLNSAKYIQLRGFTNEIARTSGQQTRKTNS